jgi:ATP-dependent Clp protease ATP-binding subunit ClpC
MFERFTERSRRVMQLATQEAQRFNHDGIGTGHILIGLLKEGSGVGGYVLKDFSINLTQLRAAIARVVLPGGPVPVTMFKLSVTLEARAAIDHSLDEAKLLHHNYVGTEHLLLGLLREPEGVAAQVLRSLKVEPQAVRAQVLMILGCDV